MENVAVREIIRAFVCHMETANSVNAKEKLRILKALTKLTEKFHVFH